MTTALAERDPVTLAPTVTTEQLDLIKRTVAKDATADELKLYLYDCARQGVHPLDKLIHFTKRAGKYTPITSIDFMRTRAADTGEYAGSDDAAFSDVETVNAVHQVGTARVTVWRLVQGQRCSFTATARWSEYCPPAGQDHMWKRMPHTMLAKCAEALALRKGFPRQLAGLYAKEEMDQAGPSGYSIEAPAPSPSALPPTREERENPAAATGETRGPSHRSVGAGHTPDGDAFPDDGLVYIARIDQSATRNPNVTKYLLTFSTGETASTIKGQLATLAEQLCQDRAPVTFTATQTKWGHDLTTLQRAERVIEVDHTEPVDVSDIPFLWLLAALLPFTGMLA